MGAGATIEARDSSSRIAFRCMPIQFNCPYCTATVRVPDSAAGKAGRCPKCETKIRIPDVGPAPPAPAAAAPPPKPAAPAKPVTAAPAPAPAAKPSAPAKAAKGGAAQADPESFFASFGGGAAAPAAAAPAEGKRAKAVPLAPAAPSPFEAPPEPEPPAVADPAPAAEGEDDALLLEADDQSADGLYFSPDEDDEPAPGSLAAQLRAKKKPMSLGVILLPILGIGVAAALVFAYIKTTETKFVGEVAGERVNLKKPIPGRIMWGECGVGEDEQKSIRSLLDKKPLPLASSLFVVSFLSDAQGLLIEAKNGYDTDIVRVDPQAVPILAGWLPRNAERLQLPRSTTIAPAAKEFATKLARTIQSQAPLKSTDFAEFRDRLALPALNRTLGHWCGAVVDNQMYPCIYEDPQGLLYFAVPTSARFFQIREKGDEPGKMLPPTFAINVTLPPRAAVQSPFSEPSGKPSTDIMDSQPEEGEKAMPAEPEEPK